MDFMLLRQLRQLKRLQAAYYDANSKDDTVIAEYLALLRAIRERYDSRNASTSRLHLGSGGHRIHGWINLDAVLDESVDVISDLRTGLPFRSGSIGFIHSEDVIEHLDQEVGRLLAEEAFRVLRPGGVMRIVTPDLLAIVKHVYLREHRRHMQWCRREFQASTGCEALNTHMRMGGEHRFLYDESELRAVLHSVGFRTRRVAFNKSPCHALRFLDLRNFGLSLYVEAIKT